MFDDQLKNTATPANLPVEPDDIFKEVEKNEAPANLPDALGAGFLKKKETPPATAPVQPAVAKAPIPEANYVPVSMAGSGLSKPVLGKIIISILALAVVGGLGYGGWWGYNNLYKSKAPSGAAPETKTDVSTAPATDTSQEVNANVSASMNNDKILFGEQVDSDRDGLDDVRERELGTMPNNTDSDTDGLSDGDEVLIWKTNPLNPDSDNDGHVDGKEVRNGYNPLGPGKIFNSGEQQSASTGTSQNQ